MPRNPRSLLHVVIASVTHSPPLPAPPSRSPSFPCLGFVSPSSQTLFSLPPRASNVPATPAAPPEAAERDLEPKCRLKFSDPTPMRRRPPA